MKIESMNRMFLPVGQGAFYCERFWELGSSINIVYDCGTHSGMRVLDRELDRVFSEDDIVDAVFISHLHEDHFNGLKHLADRCKIQRIYLPHMEPVDLRLMQLDYITHKLTSSDNAGINDKDFADSVLDNLDNEAENPTETLKKQFEDLLKIEDKSVSDDRHEYFTQTGVHYVNNNTPINVPVRQFCKYKYLAPSPFDNWHFKAFCITSRDDQMVQEVINKLKGLIPVYLKEQVTDDNLAELLGKLIKKINRGQGPNDLPTKIRDIYDKAYAKRYGKKTGTGEFNVNSLVLYSGCDNRSGLAVVRRPMCCFAKALHGNMCCHPVGKVGCLYTGDCDANTYWNALEEGLTQEEWQTVGCIQIPHHGSEGNFNEKFLVSKTLPDPATCHVISAGLGNRHKHPSESVIEMYNQRHCFPIVVTQDPGSLAEWRIQKPERYSRPEYYFEPLDYWDRWGVLRSVF